MPVKDFRVNGPREILSTYRVVTETVWALISPVQWAEPNVAQTPRGWQLRRSRSDDTGSSGQQFDVHIECAVGLECASISSREREPVRIGAGADERVVDGPAGDAHGREVGKERR